MPLPGQQDENKPPRAWPKVDREPRATRDELLRVSRRQYRGSNALPEFFTNSLNTSYASHIPSPSPERPSYGGRSRQEHRSGNNERGLAAAYNALESSTHDSESHDSSPTRSAGRRSAQKPRQSHLPSPQRSPGRKTPSPHKGRARHSHEFITDTKTPSPTRGRQRDHLVSPASDISHFSSPPVGLADVYQRIQDEETLAGQEEDGDETEGEDWTDERILQEVPNGQNRLPRNSRSPESRRRPSPLPDLDSQEAAHSPAELDQLSLFSELERASRTSSPFDEIPEPDLDEDMASQHERDEQRVKSALSNHSRPFSKARRVKKFGLTTDNLRRADGSQSGSNSEGSRSISSRASDLSLNVPNGWGRKARPGKSWLNRITEDTSTVVKSVEGTEQRSSHGSTKSDSIVDWMETTGTTPLPHGNNHSLQPSASSPNLLRLGLQSRLSPTESRSKLRDQSTTPTNTPPPRTKNAALDSIRLREIQSLNEENEAATTSKGATESRSTRILFSDIEGPASGDNNNHRHIHGTDAATENPPPDALDIDTSGTLDLKDLPEQKLHIDPNRIPLFKTTTIVYDREKTGSAASQTTKEDAHAQRPNHVRVDSRDILRTLSRVESNSPSPHRSSRDGPQRPIDAGATESKTKEQSRAQDNDRAQASNAEPSPKVEDINASKQKQAKKPPELHKPLEFRSTEKRAKSTSRIPVAVDAVEETPAPRTEKPKVYLKTPLVTGAWIETPLPIHKIDTSKAPAQQAAEQRALLDAAIAKVGTQNPVQGPILVYGDKEIPLDLELTAPKLPGSALADIVQEAKAKKGNTSASENDDTFPLDNSDIESLEGLVEVSDDGQSAAKTRDTSQTSQTGRSEKKDLTRPEDGQEGSELEPQSTAETLKTQERMLARVLTTLSNANEGVSAVLNGVLKSTVHNEPGNNTSGEVGGEECNEGGELHDFVTCDKCATRGVTLHAFRSKTGPIEWQPLMVPDYGLYTWPKDSLPVLTKRGWIALFLFGLVALELLVAERYEHPLYALSMTGYGVDIHKPQPPFILAKLAWHHGLKTILGPITHWIAAIGSFILCFFGYNLAGGCGEGYVPDSTEYLYKRVMFGDYETDGIGIGRDHSL